MNMKTIIKYIAVGVLLFLGVQVISISMNDEKATAATTDGDLNEAVQFYDEMESLTNDAMEDSYIDENERDEVKKVAQKGAMMFDEVLFEADIIDNNYKYKDLSSARRYLESVTIEFQKALPNTSHGVTSTEAELTPYMNTYTYVIEEFLPPDSVETVRATTQSQEYIQQQCDMLYSSKYQRANETKVNILVHDLSGELISSVILDESKCY